MEPISRRQALALGALGTGGVVAGALGLARTGVPWGGGTSPGGDLTPRRAGGADLVEPEVLTSADGRLRVELTMAEAEVDVGGRSARLLTYNGTVPGPTLRLRPGDTLQVRLANQLDAPTNLHVHGLHVSPEGNGDNPFLTIEPGEVFDYEFVLPADHPTGTFWYHPHHHGHVADQVFGGLYGAIVVEDDLPVSRERILIVSDLSLEADGSVSRPRMQDQMMGREGSIVLVNGQVRPRVTAAPGERQRWRVVNACTSRHLVLDLADQPVDLLGVDLGRSSALRAAEEVLLAPGNRADLLVTPYAGRTPWRALPYDRGGMGMGRGGASGPGSAILAILEVSGATVESPPPLPAATAPADLRTVEPARRRLITFTMGMGMGGGMSFGFDGRSFDPARTDQEIVGGTVEEWTLDNPTPMDHPFHLHVWPMQVVEADGKAVADPRWRDVVEVPARGRRVVRIAFEGFAGRSVYHCHILDHEDGGMMGVVEVRPAR
ncbi:multicopper oxidase family protein [Georgenia muralis]|uniref:multicopper oxidase family protein n=1 Tax=Georgenia muralis TaxID=154117 RepID=UPI000F4D9BB8|nr:multicopper oxidase family protein [Georgenia muralis]